MQASVLADGSRVVSDEKWRALGTYLVQSRHYTEALALCRQRQLAADAARKAKTK